MNYTEEDAKAAVAKGVEWLNTVKPGWRSLIDITELNMARGCNCILGQVFDLESTDYRNLSGYAYILQSQKLSHAQIVKLGFDLPYKACCTVDEETATYSKLQQAWIDAIAGRVTDTVEV